MESFGIAGSTQPYDFDLESGKLWYDTKNLPLLVENFGNQELWVNGWEFDGNNEIFYVTIVNLIDNVLIGTNCLEMKTRKHIILHNGELLKPLEKWKIFDTLISEHYPTITDELVIFNGITLLDTTVTSKEVMSFDKWKTKLYNIFSRRVEIYNIRDIVCDHALNACFI